VAAKLPRSIILLAGIILGQVVLYGPSLAGRKVLLPLEDLARSGMYVPTTSPIATVVPSPASDLILQFEPSRRFAVSELHAGRIPMWAPYHFAGAPFIWQKFSPFLMLQCCSASPVVLPWAQLLAAIVAGIGAYLFFRRVLGVGFWPAAICSWCYPMTGFFISWQGFPIGLPAYWLPWILLAVDKTVRNSDSLAPVALAGVTCLVVISGQLDVAGQVLLASGLYGLWCLFDTFRGQWFQRQARRAMALLAAGWLLGLLLATPAVLPTLEYAQSGARMSRRSAGEEERPPVGLAALPQVVLPDMYGRSIRLVNGNVMESSVAAYAGVLATLLVGPLAWFSPRHRRINWFLLGLVVFGLSWCLNVPGFVGLFRLPGLNMMSHNRLVFISSFAILALAAIGLEVFSRGPIQPRSWTIGALTLLLGLFFWALYRTMFLPEPIDTQLGQMVLQGNSGWIRDPEGVAQVQAWFQRHYAAAALWCGCGVVGWLLLWSRRPWQSRLLPALGALMLGDMLWFAYGRNAQCDRALYYPRVQVLKQIAASVPGRVIGYSCLPANLAAMCGLHDIRGYDAVDPQRLIDLLSIAAHPNSPKYLYALTQVLVPRLSLTAEGDAKLSPVLDMLGVRYVIFRGTPLPGARPAFQAPDYWVLVNPAVLPRVFVPRRVELATNKNLRLMKLASPEFDPRDVAYVEAPIQSPATCRGKAEIIKETPTRITASVNMDTPGLVVLADLWDKGWHAYLNGKRVPILRANHAIRGVVVPAGVGTLEFRYEPASFAWGLMLSGGASVVLLSWLAIVLRKRRLVQPAGQ
jgi:hypothetical protein